MEFPDWFKLKWKYYGMFYDVWTTFKFNRNQRSGFSARNVTMANFPSYVHT